MTRWVSLPSVLFGADLRSLAALRVVLGGVVLVDLAGRARSLSAHYTDEGVLPREVVRGMLDPWQLSLNMVDGGRDVQALVFGGCAVAAVAMLVGYRTRLMTILVWGLVLSIQWRNPLVLSAGDTLLRLVLFWAMFLPLGAVWSVDRVRAGAGKTVAMGFMSLGTMGLFLQIAGMYWFSVVLKSGREWRVDGSALSYALSLDQLTTPVGDYVLGFPALLTVLTFVTLGIEAFGPFLLFCPICNGPVRTGAVLAFVGLHLGILLTMDLGIFPWLGAGCMVVFLPAWFWDRVVPRGRAGLRRQAGDAPVRLRSSLVFNVLAGMCLIAVLSWNVSTVSDFRVPGFVRPAGELLGLKQRWDMFAPRPATATGWYVIAGTLRDGREVDLLTPIVRGDFQLMTEVSWERPGRIAGTYDGDKYWRKYFDDIRTYTGTSYQHYLADYTCRMWNGAHDRSAELVVIRIVYMSQATLPDYRRSTPERDGMSFHACRNTYS